MVQSCPEASPAKWHLAHTTWFFESFILREFLPGYRSSTKTFPGCSTATTRVSAPFLRSVCASSFSRPGLDEVLRYREHVDDAIERLLEREPEPEALNASNWGRTTKSSIRSCC